MTYGELFYQGKDILSSVGIAEAKLDARLLLEYVCGTDLGDLLVHGDREVHPDQESAYVALIARRAERIPLQYLTGTQDFMGLTFAVSESVLIPRQDTEILVEEVLKYLHDGMKVLDMCTGSGCILISLLHYTNHCEGVGIDISQSALDLAKQNGERLLDGKSDAGEGEGFGSIRFLQGDLFEPVEGKFDVIVSNPPYIRSGETQALMPEVRDHEPLQALDGGADGLLFYRRIVAESGKYLYGGGMLFFETGCDQAEAVGELMRQAGFLDIRVVKDYGGLDRVVSGTLGFGEAGRNSKEW